MKNISVILAKKESKRLQNKNFLEFNHFPVLTNSIAEADKTCLFEKIIISTDSKYINVNFGNSEIYQRKPENTKQDSTMYDALIEVLEAYSGYDNVCLIHACQPLLTAEYIIQAYEVFKTGKYDTVIPAVNIGGYVMYKDNDRLFTVNPKSKTTNTQGQKTQFYQNVGMFYWCNIEALYRNKSVLCDNMGYIELTEMQCQDIDNQDDWDIALWKYGRMNK